MTEVFSAILKASFQGSIVILAVLVLRLVLKRAPKSLFCLLWLLAGLRLALPFEVQSPFSLQPRLEDDVPGIVMDQPVQVPDILIQNPEGQPLDTPADPVEIPELPEGHRDDLHTDSFLYGVEDGAVKPIHYRDIAAQIWLLGVAGMFLISTVSYFRLKRRVREAYRIENGCFECPGLDTAFVLGFFPARIYLPMGLSDQEKQFIYDHENTHIARHDHWFKVLGYAVLSIHWFNPLVWLGYSLLCRDMELACDEQVVKDMSLHERKAYSAALLSCGGRTARLAACPVAFGESNPKKRILNVLNYKRPSFWIMLLAVIAVIFVSACLLTSPENKTEVPEDASWNLEMKVTDVSATGLVVKFVQNGIFPGSDRGQLMYGTDYTLERLENGQWVAVEELPQEYPVAWQTVGYTIEINSIANHHIDWDWLYGELPAGQYRIGKRVTLDYFIGDDENQIFYTEFTIGDSNLSQCMNALEAIQSRDAVHILEIYTFSGDGMPEGQIDRNYFLSDGTWLRVDATGGSFTGVFQNGEVVYIAQDHEAIFDWEKAENPEELDTQPWLLTFDLSNADAEVISREETQGGYTLRLMIHEAVDMEWLRGEEYYADFSFDTQGNLRNVIAHVVSGFSELTVQMIPVQLSKASIQSTIQQYAGSLMDLELTEEDYLALCRDALAELQSREQYHISETLAYFTGEREDSRNYVVFWKDGANWLRESYVTRMRTNADFLYYEGALYIRKQEDGSEAVWNRIDGGEDYGDPWLRLIQWDDQKVTFDGTAQEGEEFRISVHIQGVPPTLGFEDIREYSVLFCFDKTWNLTRAILGAQMDNTRIISDLTIENTLHSSIQKKLENVAAQRPDAPQVSLTEEQWLEKCRTALENYRGQGSWVVLVDNQFTGETVLNETSSQLWYIHGEDWVKQAIVSTGDFLQERWTMKKDNSYYFWESHTLHDSENGDSYVSDWQKSEDASDWILPWPVDFDWDSAEIKFLEARTDGADSQVCLVISGSPYPAHYEEQVEEYLVTLYLWPSGELWQLQLEYEEIQYTGDKLRIRSTIYPNAAAPEEAEKMIQLKYNAISE